MDRQMYGGVYDQKQQFGIDQYYKRDDFGNYAYGYANGNSEKYEVGNPQGGVKGHYMYVDSNGLNQRVEYIADDQGFRIVGGEDKRFKREAEPSMRMMTSYMDSSLMDDDMMQMERALARNGMSMNRRMFDRQMFDDRRQMSDRQMSQRQMSDRNMMYRNDMMNNRNNMMNMMDSRDNMMTMMNNRDMMRMNQMSRNQMNNNNRMMDMYDMSMPQMRMDDGILGERNTMSQRMEIERIPENNVSFMLF